MEIDMSDGQNSFPKRKIVLLAVIVINLLCIFALFEIVGKFMASSSPLPDYLRVKQYLEMIGDELSEVKCLQAGVVNQKECLQLEYKNVLDGFVELDPIIASNINLVILNGDLGYLLVYSEDASVASALISEFDTASEPEAISRILRDKSPFGQSQYDGFIYDPVFDEIQVEDEYGEDNTKKPIIYWFQYK